MFGRNKRKNPQQNGKPKPVPKSPVQSRVKSSLLSLESRLMFDAAATATAAEVNQEQVAQEQAEAAVSGDSSGETQASSDSQGLLRAVTTYMPAESRHEVVFVDPTVPDYQNLLKGMDLNIEVIMLDGNRDGIEQMASALAGRTGIDAIHLIAAGNDAQLHLGTSALTQDSLSTTYAQQFQQIGQSLSANADLLIYGSNFGNGDAGQAAMQTLAQLTGADVAASTDRTGSAAADGNWQLEVSTGSIETGVVIGASTQATWDHVLTTAASDPPTTDGDHLLVAPDSPATTRQELVFVDTAVEDYQGLLAGISPNAEVIILDSTRDGVQQISEALQGRTNIDAVHILSHGVDGALELGGSWLNGLMLEARADTIAQWGQALSADADILLYGCNVAADAEGQAFVNRLAELTGADVAASQDTTGNAAQGGDWNLEYATGSIESESAIDAETQQDWAEVMAITAGTSTSAATASGTTASSLTWSHTVGAGSNGILIIDVSIRTNSGVTVSSVTYGGVALTLIGSDTSSKDHVEMWYLKAPTAGTGNIVVTLTGSESIAAGATKFFGVNQTTSYGSLTTGNGSGDPSLTVASATGELVVDAVSDRDVDSESVGAGQTLLLTDKAGTGSNDAWVGSSTEAGAASVTMSWTTTGAGAGEWAAVAVSLKPFINTAPILDATKSPVLTAINEDAGAPSGAVGTLVSSLVDFASPSGQVDNITDPDSGAQLGIAITAANTTNGTWYYSTNNGTTWNALGAVASNSAILLAADANTRLYFQPNANYNGTIANAITFRAWDQTSGTNGGTADTSSNGGSTAFSTATDTASLTINAVNDAPVLADTALSLTVAEDAGAPSGAVGSLVSAFTGGITDVDSGAVKGLAITGSNETTGTWYYTTNGGTTWTAVGSVSNTSALLLADNGSTRLYFAPNADYNGTSTAALTVRAWDQTSGTAGTKVSTASTGGTTAFSSATDTIDVTVTAVNDAPVLANTALSLTVAEDAGAPSGVVGSLVSAFTGGITDVDSGAVKGLAITGSNETTGTWYYTTNGGTTWTAVGTVSSASSLLLADNGSTRLYFAPNADYNGTSTAALTVRAWDQTSGTAGTKVSTASTGGHDGLLQRHGYHRRDGDGGERRTGVHQSQRHAGLY